MNKRTIIKTLLFCSLIFTGIVKHSAAQSHDILWTKTFGGNKNDWCSFVRQTNDGGFIVTGKTYNYGTDIINVWLIKTNASGDTLWTKAYSRNNTLGEVVVQQTSDGGYILTTETIENSGFMDVWLIKTDALGDTMWTKTFGQDLDDMGQFVQQTSDGGYIITGLFTFNDINRHQDVWLIKTNVSGDTLWTKTFGQGLFDIGRCVQQTSDGGYILTGLTIKQYDFDLWLIKVDSLGNEMWSKTFGGNDWDEGKYVSQTSDGGFIIAGFTSSFGAGGEDFWLIRTDISGNELWSKTYGGAGNDKAYSVELTSDGGYILTGETLSFGAGMLDGYLIKTDSLGNEIWSKTFGGSDWDLCKSVQETSDGGLIVAGSSKSFGNVGAADFWLIRMAPGPTIVIDNSTIEISNTFKLKQNYPNPFNPKTVISYQLPVDSDVELSIHNITGQSVTTLVSEKQPAGNYQYEWIASHLPSGVYLYRLQAGNFVATKKLILLR